MTDTQIRRREYLTRTSAVLGASIIGTAGCVGSSTSDYPTDDIRFVVPFAAGGGFDEIARLAKPYWEENLSEDATVVVENVEGGGSAIGTSQVYNAEPDGHSLLFGDPFSGGGRQIVTDPGYNLREMSFVGHFSHEPHGIAAAKGLELSGWDDFVDRIEEFNFATQGTGSVAHITPLMLAEITGTFDIDDVNFVHYTGTGEAIAGLERGEVDIYMVGSASSALVARAVEGVEHFMMFTDGETGEEFFPETRYYAAEEDIPSIEEYIDVSSFQRFVAGPPDVSDEILQTQREAMDGILTDDTFNQEALDANRFLLDTSVGEDSRELAMKKLDYLSEDPWPSLLSEMLEG